MTTVRIGPNLGIEGAADIRERLLKPSRSKSPVTVAIERVDQLHSAAIQVLCAFVRDRAASKGATHIDAPEELRSAARLLGVDSLLGLGTTAEVLT